MEQHAYILRAIAEYMELKPLRRIAREPGVKAAYRITIRYLRDRARNTVATLTRSVLQPPCLEVVYEGLFGLQPLVYQIDVQRYEAFALALQHARFDRLGDQSNVPFYGVDLWLVERAAGEFYRSIVMAPQSAGQDHIAVFAAVRHYLPEVVREVQ